MNMKYYCSSIFLHITLVLIFILKWQASTETVRLGDNAMQAMSSYIYKGETRHNNVVHTEIMKKEKAIAIHAKKIVASANASLASNNSGETTDALLAALHAAIQRQQHYPLSAMQMERQGRATMIFTLFPDGRIQSLRVLKSSGTDSLDAAALAAVQDAVPFHQVDKYLKFAKEFRIDVVFELA